jgi:ureidoacrylate peracid hydrolase
VEAAVVEFPLIPPKTALINVDMQRCFVDGSPLASPEGPALVKRVNRLTRTCRAAGILVVHTRGWMKKDRSDIGVMGDLVPPFIVDLYTEGEESAELDDGLEVEPIDVVLDKTRYGAFHGTDLQATLQSRDIDTVIVTGIATNVCCDTTARRRRSAASVRRLDSTTSALERALGGVRRSCAP